MAEQQKNQRAPKIKNRISKQTRDIKLAGNVYPITKRLDEVTGSTTILGEVIKESNSENENNQEIVPVESDSDKSEGDNIRALPNSSIFSDLMTKTIRSLISSSDALKIKPSPSGATFLGVLLYALGGDEVRLRDID